MTTRKSLRNEGEIERVLSDPAASHWLKSALNAALSRDPVDAANDAEVLYQLLQRRYLELSELRDTEENGAF